MEVLKNKCALITGATGGLGENIAKFLANQGTNLVLLGRNLEKLKKTIIKLFPVLRYELPKNIACATNF